MLAPELRTRDPRAHPQARRQLLVRLVIPSMAAIGIGAIAVVSIAFVLGPSNVLRAFSSPHPEWIALSVGANLLVYPAYMIVYRQLVAYRARSSATGYRARELPLVRRAVMAGFGLFSIGGGFRVDREVLQILDEDDRSARVQVLALATLEWAVLAPVACLVSIGLLAGRADVIPSLLWPWAVAVPLGFGLALWVSQPRRAERLSRIGGTSRDWILLGLEGVGALRVLIRHPRRSAPAWLGMTLYWAADVTVFYGALRGFGLDPGIGVVIIAYATGYAATRRSLPLGGAGVTEVLMTYSLYWVHQPLAPALAAVVVYRSFNFLIAAAPGVIAYHHLQEEITSGKAATAAHGSTT